MAKSRFVFTSNDVEITQCVMCKHYLGDRKCVAFPEKIPGQIWNNEFDHRIPYPGDNGIQFERIKK